MGKGYIGNEPTALPINATDLTGTLPNSVFPTGAVVQTVYAEYLTNADLSTVIPADDTIPQITEGTEIVTATITPRSATNKIVARFQGSGAHGTADTALITALFRDAGANALAASTAQVSSTGARVTMVLEFQETAPGTSTYTYRIRVGANSGTMRMNGAAASRFFGGVARATLILEEIKA